MTQESHLWSKQSYEALGQWENWKNLLDMCNAIRYGFRQYRLPTPGKVIDIKEAEERIKYIDTEWEREHRARGNESQKPCPDFSKSPIETQCYLHSILESKDPAIGEYYFPY